MDNGVENTVKPSCLSEQINLKAFTLIILKQFIQPTWGLNRGSADNRSGLARTTVPMRHRDKRLKVVYNF